MPRYELKRYLTEFERKRIEDTQSARTSIIKTAALVKSSRANLLMRVYINVRKIELPKRKTRFYRDAYGFHNRKHILILDRSLSDSFSDIYWVKYGKDSRKASTLTKLPQYLKLVDSIL